MYETPRRRVQFVIASDALTPEDIISSIEITPDRTAWKGLVPPDSMLRYPRPARDHSWEIRETGGVDTPVPVLLDAVLVRVAPAAQRIGELRARGCRVILSVVLYTSPADPVGPGFALTWDQIKLLGACGADFEVDQYL
ncbi:DUF4279 domain-containing protein [Nocardia sp. CA2R105]|uniref:DUF4279 domain-containing protein n=1 Tax=Nocardia coffeae TaxID=2873381 RepID=UPI001CA628E0|nr:DUF4279 domain-containing protein [Nocardia coffeae]